MRDDVTRDYVYRPRHSHIADIVFERVLTDVQERFDEYVRLISALDVDYNSDREAFRKLLNGKHLISLFKDPQMIRQLYRIGRERNKEDSPMLMQQEAIFEMTSSGGSLDTAESLLRIAHDSARGGHTKAAIAHSLAVLALIKAKRAKEPLERQKLRSEARKIALELSTRLPISSYPFTTLIQIDLDELSVFMEQGDETLIERKIKETEKSISRAVQNFSDDTFILDAEARFAEMVNKSPKALEALRKAFSSNKRSPYIALRLAKMYEKEGLSDRAIETLIECLEENQNDKIVNFNLAMLMMRHKKGSQSEVKHFLRRAFTEGDTNYTAQFYYARFLYLEGHRTDAMQIFTKLSDAPVDIRMKKGGKAPIVDENDIAVRFSGAVHQVESSYSFVLRDGPQDRLFAHCLNSEPLFWNTLKAQQRITFEIAFNYRGPVAIKLQPEIF
jgi:tetratricopeptide (TPR) repeat protein